MKKIAIFLPSRSENVSEDLDGKGCASREQIADWLASHLAPKNEVHVFTSQLDSKHYPNLHYIPQEMAAPMLTAYEWDAVVSFDFPSVAGLPDLRHTVKRLIVSQNYFEIPPDGFVPEVFDEVDAWVYPSNYALENCSFVNGVNPDHGVVIPYAVDTRFFDQNFTQHDNLRFIYVNQAESGLAQTLNMWPDIKNLYPDAQLTVATPVDEFVEQVQWSHSIQSELALDIRDKIGGVRYVGKLGRKAFARELHNADILLYPAEPLAPLEIGSLPILQAASMGVVPIFAPVDALPELYSGMGLATQPENFINQIEFTVEHLKEEKDRTQSMVEAKTTFEDTVQAWRDILNVD